MLIFLPWLVIQGGLSRPSPVEVRTWDSPSLFILKSVKFLMESAIQTNQEAVKDGDEDVHRSPTCWTLKNKGQDWVCWQTCNRKGPQYNIVFKAGGYSVWWHVDSQLKQAHFREAVCSREPALQTLQEPQTRSGICEKWQPGRMLSSKDVWEI